MNRREQQRKPWPGEAAVIDKNSRLCSWLTAGPSVI
jgi:hypothetical protein